MGPHQLDYPSPGCARAVLGDLAVNPDCWELSWIAPFEKLLTKIESHISLRGVVFTGPEGRFPSELDASILTLTSRPGEWEAFCLRLARCFHRISRMPWNTVAAAGGPCTGAGLALALACQARIAAAGVAVGFPEIEFGRIPVFGGTQRLTRILGLTRAAPWIAGGRCANVEEAVKAAFFHAAVAPAELEARALDYAEGRARPGPAPRLGWFAQRTGWGRRRALRRIEAEILTGVDGGGVAPRAAIAAASRGLAVSLERSLEIEARLDAEALDTPAGRELTRIERLRAEARRFAQGLTHTEGAAPREPSPFDGCPIVEIAAGPELAADAVEVARRAVIREGRVPLRIAAPGRSVVRRLLGIHLVEALALSSEGFDTGELDRLASEYGMAAGPFQWIERLGRRQVMDMLRTLESRHGARFRLGDATARFLATEGEGAANARPEVRHDIDDRAGARDRLVLCIAAEALRAVRDQDVDSADLADLAAVFGIGYPKLRGGPLRDLTLRGAAGRARLAEIAARRGEAFHIDADILLTS